MSNNRPTYYDDLKAKGYSPRDYVKFRTVTAAYWGLEAIAVGQIAYAWVPAVFGQEFTIRQIHHLMMWVFIIFSMIHVHLVAFHDYVEGRGEASSMVSGFKFIYTERFEDEVKDIKRRKIRARTTRKEVEEANT